ncbi:ABC transporter permease [Patescibacteria group bacterium]|nr:ABC transporter permease [Patescibacteria group bacterium]MBU1867970.1 ABC transporter permease [Patescibacteria group bacterium]
MQRSIKQIIIFTKKEILEVFREPATFLIVLLVFPLSLMFLFGYALKFKVDNIELALLDLDRSQESMALVEELKDEDRLVILQDVNEDDIKQRLDEGKIKAALVIPEGFEEDVDNQKRVEFSLIVDGTKPLSYMAISEILSEIIVDENRRLVGERLSEMNLDFETHLIAVDEEVLYNPDFTDKDFFIPGIIGVVVTTVTMLLACMAVVKEKETGTIETIFAAPIPRAVFIIGKCVPYTLIGLASLLISTALGIYWFHVPFVGSIFLFGALSFLFILSSLGLGLLFSTFVQNTIQATFCVILFVIISILLSGFIFPIASMPEAIQKIVLVLPLTYYIRIIRGVMIQGLDWSMLRSETLSLAGITVCTLFLSIIGFTKRLD